MGCREKHKLKRKLLLPFSQNVNFHLLIRVCLLLHTPLHPSASRAPSDNRQRPPFIPPPHRNSQVSVLHLQNAALQHLFIRKTFRPFKCTHCGKAFRDKDKLEQHLRVHGRDAYTFSCHVCTKSFMSDSALEDHLLMHTDSRSFSCILCPETFERLDLLKEHVRVHEVDGSYSCPACKKMFDDFIQVG